MMNGLELRWLVRTAVQEGVVIPVGPSAVFPILQYRRMEILADDDHMPRVQWSEWKDVPIVYEPKAPQMVIREGP